MCTVVGLYNIMNSKNRALIMFVTVVW